MRWSPKLSIVIRLEAHLSERARDDLGSIAAYIAAGDPSAASVNEEDAVSVATICHSALRPLID